MLDRNAGGGLHGGMWLDVLRSVLYGMVVVMLAGVALVAGIITAKKTENPPPLKIVKEVPPEQRAAARELVEQALAGRLAGNHGVALASLEQARAQDPGMRGLEYQFALTYLDLGQYGPADDAARRSVDRGEEKSNAQAVRGWILLEKARAEGAVAAEGTEILARLEESRATDPLNPMPLYIMGEYYRADGRPGLAVEAYRRALERVSKTDSFLVTTVKAGLAGLRLNYRADHPPLKLHAVNGVLPPEQLFFGAADALLRGDNGAAAGFLREAKTRMPEEVFASVLQDSFFQDYLEASILDDPPQPAPQP